MLSEHKLALPPKTLDNASAAEKSVLEKNLGPGRFHSEPVDRDGEFAGLAQACLSSTLHRLPLIS